MNDYLVVLSAEGYTQGGTSLSGTWRFKYSGTWTEQSGKGGWLPEYNVNNTSMTAAQIAAVNSNVTAEKIAYYDEQLSGLEQLIDSI